MKDLERIKRINKGEWLEGQHLKESKQSIWTPVCIGFVILSAIYFIIRFLIA